jgi:chromosome segregation ATPase
VDAYWGQWGSAAGAAIVGVFGGFRYARRGLSRDNVETARDRAEINILKELQEQAKSAQTRAEVAEKERTEALIEVGKLQGQIVVLSERMTVMATELERTRTELSASRMEVQTLNNLVRAHIAATS